jgi:hypothetical protein
MQSRISNRRDTKPNIEMRIGDFAIRKKIACFDEVEKCPEEVPFRPYAEKAIFS